jgi:hypothetical protein
MRLEMRRIAIIMAGLLVVAGSVLVGGATSKANAAAQHTAKNPLSITGSVVAGVTSVQPGQLLTFDFKMKNHGTGAATVDFHYTWSHASEQDIICPLVSSGADIYPDTPFCEPGSLGRGSSTQSAIVLKAPHTAGTVVVIACADDEDNGATPKCTSLSVPEG